MRKTLFVSLFAVAALSACKSSARDTPAPDNTAKNERDRVETPTADNAVHEPSDLALTQKIRQAVMADGSLSTNAHNCKIVVQSGTVTLVGPVTSDTERTKLEQIAMANAGDRKIVNQLEVAKQ